MTTPMPKPVIRVEDLGKRFMIGIKQEKEGVLATTLRLLTGSTSRRELWALRHINFEVNRGEAFGIIGPNGAGKSTLLLLMAQILGPTEGQCRISNKINCFFQLGAALQPQLTVLENFSLCSTLLGLNRSELRARLPAMIAFSALEPYLYAKYGELSGGLAARLPFAAAVHTDLEIILVDEMLTVGDQTFQLKCLKTFHDFKTQGKTLVIVSHNLQLIASLCPRTLYLNAGKAVFLGDSASAVKMLTRDLGNSGQPERQSQGGETDGRAVRPSRRQIREVIDAEVSRIRRELSASPEARLESGAQEFTDEGEADTPIDGQTKKIIDAEVSRISLDLRSSLEEQRRNGVEEAKTEGEAAAALDADTHPVPEPEQPAVREESKTEGEAGAAPDADTPPAPEPNPPGRVAGDPAIAGGELKAGGEGNAALFGQIREIVNAEISKIRLEVQASLEEQRRAAERELKAEGEGNAALFWQMQEVINAEIPKIRLEARASLEEQRKAAAQERETWFTAVRQTIQASLEEQCRLSAQEQEAWFTGIRKIIQDHQNTQREQVAEILPAMIVYPGVELAWKKLLGHTGPLAVCSSVQAAFGTVIQALMAGPGENRLRPGDEVIMTAACDTWYIQGLLSYGLVPVFVDLDPQTYNLDTRQLPQALSSRTRAVILHTTNRYAPMDQVSAFCVKNNLRFIECVPGKLTGLYDGRFLGTIGDFGVYAPRAAYSAWGLALARSESMSGIFQQILFGTGPGAGEAPEINEQLFLRPSKAQESGLSAAFGAFRDWGTEMHNLEKGFSDYSNFFASFPDYFIIPKPPPLVRVSPVRFTFILKKGIPFTIRDLLTSGMDSQASPMSFPWPQSLIGNPSCRKVNALPHTAELGARGVFFPIFTSAERRARFFAEFSRWMKSRI